MIVDIAIVGAGPAGLILARACAEAGLRVAIVDPRGDSPWPHHLSLWADEARACRWSVPLEHVWPHVLVHLGATRRHRLDRAYALLDTRRFHQECAQSLRTAGARWIVASATSVVHRDEESELVTGTSSLRARIVADCSGHRPLLVRRLGPPPTAAQTAFGIVADVDDLKFDRHSALLMDFSTEPFGQPPRGKPTFLYVLPFGPHRALFEETCLSASPPLQMDEARSRLTRRLQGMGIRVRRVVSEERVYIPTDPPLPDLNQPTLGFGAAASFVHPATGYSVATSLRLAPILAECLRARLRTDAPAKAVFEAWRQLWTPERTRTRWMHMRGLGVIHRLGWRGAQDFFDACFKMPPQRWSAILSPEASPAETGAAYVAMGVHLPPRALLTVVPDLVRGLVRPRG